MKLVKQSERAFLDNNLSYSPTTGVTLLVDNIQPSQSGGNITLGNKVINNVKTATASTDGLTTGLIVGGDQFVTVTSSASTKIVSLPAVITVPIGTVIRGVVGANGFKLQVAAANATAVNLNGVTTNVKAAIPANVSFRVELISATQWILTTLTALGAVGTAIVPA